MLLGFGGSINLEQAAMSPAAYQLLEEIGVEFKALQDAGALRLPAIQCRCGFRLLPGEDVYGDNRIVVGPWGLALAGEGDYRSLIAALKLPPRRRITHKPGGGWQGLSCRHTAEEKEAYLRSNSYADFLYKKVGISRWAAS